ncbi:hypothetical protein B9Z19DRAFT_1065773 [Tuber borchii]|uniref:Uncharacterized protein n=1 Tax=Tuber borchii TaxID=42251 RepID=A0A2T6ZPX8_TUBBO|nr:hypothetical protein B9Z19DRAFT_1065773 [Tuber borchii]
MLDILLLTTILLQRLCSLIIFLCFGNVYYAPHRGNFPTPSASFRLVNRGSTQSYLGFASSIDCEMEAVRVCLIGCSSGREWAVAPIAGDDTSDGDTMMVLQLVTLLK